jgi:hypothetical protein
MISKYFLKMTLHPAERLIASRGPTAAAFSFFRLLVLLLVIEIDH